MAELNSIVIDPHDITYEEKKELYNELFSVGTFTEAKTLNDKLILISLVSYAYLQLKKKDNRVTPLKILVQITGNKADDSFFYAMLEALSILVEDFCYFTDEADSCGLKTSAEIINKIKKILDSWLPF